MDAPAVDGKRHRSGLDLPAAAQPNDPGLPGVRLLTHHDTTKLPREDRQKPSKSGETLRHLGSSTPRIERQFDQRSTQRALTGCLHRLLELFRCRTRPPLAGKASRHHVKAQVAAPDARCARCEQHALESKSELSGDSLVFVLRRRSQHQHAFEVVCELRLVAGQTTSVIDRATPVGEADHPVRRLHDEAADGLRVELRASVGLLQMLHLDDGVIGVLKNLERDAGHLVLVVRDPSLDASQHSALYFFVGFDQRGQVCEGTFKTCCCASTAQSRPLCAGRTAPGFVQARQCLRQLLVLSDTGQ